MKSSGTATPSPRCTRSGCDVSETYGVEIRQPAEVVVLVLAVTVAVDALAHD